VTKPYYPLASANWTYGVSASGNQWYVSILENHLCHIPTRYFSGIVFTDTVTIGPELVIAQQPIVVASQFPAGVNTSFGGILGWVQTLIPLNPR
jgi:hypothetical protein